MKRFLLFIFIILQYYSLYSQTITVQAPKVVAVGETFSIAFVVSGKADKFTPPPLSDFRVIAGPVQAHSKSNVNGQVTENYTISYYIDASKEGKYIIGESEAEVNGKTIKSNPYTIEVVKSDGSLKPQQSQEPNQATEQSTSVQNEDLYARLELNRSTLYKGEHLVATVKLYSRVGISGLQDFKLPAFTGFFSQEMEVPSNEASLHRENVNGKIYNVAVLKRYVLIPQQTGSIILEPLEMTLAVQVAKKRQASRNVFDDFFDSPYQELSKKIVSPSVAITVKNLPSGAPASFKGAVGSFKLESSIDKTQTQANQALSYTISISGTGNLKLIEQPTIIFPSDFDKYDPKLTENVKTTASGSVGSKQWEFAVIPRSAGNFNVPAVEFTYFDPSKDSYITIKSKDISLVVDKDPSGGTATTTVPGTNQQNIRHLGQDILFIKTTPLVLQAKGAFFLGSTAYYLLFLGLLVITILLYLVFRKRVKDSKNIALMRNKKANKIAHKRLKLSGNLLKQGNMNGFYEELLRAMWGYASDKLNIPLSGLSRDNAQENMLGHNLEQLDIDTFLKVIDECEFARYAPGEGRNKMEHIFNDAISVISKFEQIIR